MTEQPPVVSESIVDLVVGLVYNKYTRATYRSALQPFMGSELTKANIQREVVSWGGLAKSTIRVRRTALRLMVDTLASMEVVKPDLLNGIRFPHGKPAKIRKALHDDEVTAVLEATENDEELLLLLVLLDTGLRLGSVTEITIGNLLSESFNVKTKRGKVVTVYPTSEIKRVAKQLACADDEYAFSNKSGSPLSYKTLYRKCKEIGKRASVELIPHRIRHTFITRLVDTVGDISIAAKAAGHSSVDTTMRYRHVDAVTIRNAIYGASVAQGRTYHVLPEHDT